jgi:hypothetical protein
MISKVAIHNFKCLRDVTIQLERFTVFVGPNASGKSSILQALDLLCRSFWDQQEGSVEGELLQAVSRGSTDSVELVGESGGNGYRYRMSSRYSPMNPFRQNQFASANGPAWSGDGRGFASDLNSADWKRWTAAEGKQAPLPPSVLLRLEASKLIPVGPFATDPAVMASDGSGLHSADRVLVEAVPGGGRRRTVEWE